jgi:hypothetical protein
VAVGVLFILVRVVTRTPVMPAVVGVVGVGISAVLAILTDRPENNFIPGFLLNGFFILVLLISVIARWPIVGLVAGFLTGDSTGWRKDKAKMRVAVIGTALLIAVFAVRLAVQVPLYLAGAVQALGATKLIMGVPLYALTLWIIWLLMRTAYARPVER